MKKISGIVCLYLIITGFTGNAQDTLVAPKAPVAKSKKNPIATSMPRNEKEWLQDQIDCLTKPTMYGRGYVNGGLDSAAKYLLGQYYRLHLQPVDTDGNFTQGFAFPVNTFPGKMAFSINGDVLNPGADYLIDPASSSFSAEDLDVQKINLDKIKDASALNGIISSFDGKSAYYLENIAYACQMLQISRSDFVALLPKGCYIIPDEKKLSWHVSRETIPATVFYVKLDLLPKKLKKMTAEVTAVFNPPAWNVNLIGEAPGIVKDTYIVFTAHYDHLGMMGESVIFPGGNENASGVAMMLSLASYFKSHPQRYTLVFIAFAGEEASLMGSEFFTFHPTIPLKNIKFLTNLDMVGDASDGISVVNATLFPRHFDMLQKINEIGQYVPEITIKGPAANGDQYHFTEAGVPSFFIFANGGHGFYNDIYDAGDALTLNNATGVAKLLIDFVKQL